MFSIKSAALSHPGRKRSNNQDSVASFEPQDPQEVAASGNLYIVADGVGGAVKGEKASQYAAEKVRYEYYRYPELHPGKRMEGIIRQACREIFDHAQENEAGRMATTMVAAVVRGNLLTVANVGDSRAYLIRGGKIKQITQDHSLVGEMVRDGTMTEEEAFRSRMKNRLTRSLGGDPDTHVDIFPDIPLQVGDKLLLCSDGLTRYARNADILGMSSEGYPDEITARMIDFANQSGGADNISAILVYFGDKSEAVVSATPDTGPTVYSKKKSKKGVGGSIPAWLFIVLGFILMLIIGIITLRILRPDLMAVTPPIPTPDHAAQPVQPTQPAVEPVPPDSLEPLPPPEEVPPPGDELQPGEVPPPGDEQPGEGPPPPEEVPPEEVPDGDEICVHQLTATLAQTLTIYALNYEPPATNYSYYSYCEPPVEIFVKCPGVSAPIDNPKGLSANNFIVIPGVDTEHCTLRGGYIVKNEE